MMRLIEFQEQYLSSSVKSGPRLQTTANGRTVCTLHQGNIGEYIVSLCLMLPWVERPTLSPVAILKLGEVYKS